MKEQLLKWGAGVFVSLPTYLVGGVDVMLSTLILFMALDYITGLLASGVEGKISSKVGYKGIIKKVGILIVIVVCFQLDKIGLNEVFTSLPFDSPAKTLAIVYYIGMEGISNLENLGRMGVPLPDFLKKAFEILKDKGNNKNV